jgi:hypothetical protein
MASYEAVPSSDADADRLSPQPTDPVPPQLKPQKATRLRRFVLFTSLVVFIAFASYELGRYSVIHNRDAHASDINSPGTHQVTTDVDNSTSIDKTADMSHHNHHRGKLNVG